MNFKNSTTRNYKLFFLVLVLLFSYLWARQITERSPEELLVLGGVAGAIFFTYFFPNMALYLIVVLIPIQLYFDIIGTYSISVAQLLIILILIFQLIDNAIKKDLSIFQSPLTLALILYISVAGFSLLNSVILSSSIPALLRTMANFSLFFVVLSVVKTRDQVKKVIFLLLVTATVISVFAIIQGCLSEQILEGFIRSHPLLMKFFFREDEVFKSIMLAPSQLHRPFLPMGSPDILSEFLYILLPLAFILRYDGENWGINKFCLYLLIAFGWVAMIFSNSRGGFLGLFISFGVLAILTKNFKFVFRPLMYLSIFGGSAIIIFWNELKLGILSRVLDISQILTSFKEGRLKFWLAGLEIFKNYPLIGAGYGSLFKMLDRYGVKWWGWGRFMGYQITPNYSHNMYIDTAAELGILGLTVFLWLSFRVLKLAYNNFTQTEDKELKCLSLWYFCIFVGILVHSIFDTFLFYGPRISMLFWLISGLVVSLKRIGEEEESGEDLLSLRR